jgi:hypothetical protein
MPCLELNVAVAGYFWNAADGLEHEAAAIVNLRGGQMAGVPHDVSSIGPFFSSHQACGGQVRFGLIAAEVAALSFRQMTDRSEVEAEKPGQPFSDAEIDVAAQVIKDKLLGRRDGGLRNVLRLNFPDDEILAMAEAALPAARAAK